MNTTTLRYRDADGVWTEAKSTAGDGTPEPPAAPPLVAQRLVLDLPSGNQEVRCVRPAENASAEGFRRLDNEILAGLRLVRAAAGRAHPREVTRLIGYEADSAWPFVLLEPLRGEEVGEFAGMMMAEQRRRFQVSLLRAVRWLNTAGIAHRGISPATVRWDGEDVQITDFSLAGLIGTPRTVCGAMPWQAPEQRAGRATGDIGPTDDIWAVGCLIYHVTTGEDLDDPGKLRDHPDLEALLKNVIAAPVDRPSAQRLLDRLGEADAPPRAPGANADFVRGRSEFFAHRRRKHPDLPAESEHPAASAVPAPAPASDAAGAAPEASPTGSASGGRARWVWAAVAVVALLAVVLAVGW